MNNRRLSNPRKLSDGPRPINAVVNSKFIARGAGFVDRSYCQAGPPSGASDPVHVNAIAFGNLNEKVPKSIRTNSRIELSRDVKPRGCRRNVVRTPPCHLL